MILSDFFLAILDFWATERLYRLFPDSTPRILTFLRALLVNNTTLAFLSIRVLGLHKSILHGSHTLGVAITVATAEVDASTAAEDDSGSPFTMANVVDSLSWSWDPPKILGDVFEAVIGCVFLDDGLRLERIYDVLDGVYADIMPHLQAIERRDFLSNLIMYCQERHCSGIKIKYIPLPAFAPSRVQVS